MDTMKRYEFTVVTTDLTTGRDTGYNLTVWATNRDDAWQQVQETTSTIGTPYMILSDIDMKENQ